MRTRLMAITVALGTLALAACSGGDAPSIAGVPATVAIGTATPSPDPAGSSEVASFASLQYGYTAALPSGWTALPATSGWDGGDVDHTAAYADRLADVDGNEFFAMGTPTDQSTDEFAAAHLSWLAENRGCPEPAVETTLIIDGVPGVRATIHCPDGVFGPTLVSKAIVVKDGIGIIVTSFSPDTGGDDFAPFDALIASMRWSARP